LQLFLDGQKQRKGVEVNILYIFQIQFQMAEILFSQSTHHLANLIAVFFAFELTAQFDDFSFTHHRLHIDVHYRALVRPF
jgi:hypothetical protein